MNYFIFLHKDNVFMQWSLLIISGILEPPEFNDANTALKKKEEKNSFQDAWMLVHYEEAKINIRHFHQAK